MDMNPSAELYVRSKSSVMSGCPFEENILSGLLNRLDLGVQGASNPDCSGKKPLSPFVLCATLIALKPQRNPMHLMVKGKAPPSPVPDVVVEMEVVSPEPAVAFSVAVVPDTNSLKRGASEGSEDLDGVPSSKASRTV